MNNWGGLHPGLVEASATLILLLMFTLLAVRINSLLCLEVPRRQVKNSSHPLFLVAPGLSGFVPVAEMTWTVPHELILRPLLIPQPWVAQKPLLAHLNKMANRRC